MATTIFEIIQHIPPSREIHSTVEGKVRITLMDESDLSDYPVHTSGGGCYTRNGQYLNKDGCECNLFPSCKCRDWKEWAEVLVEDGDLVIHKSGRVVRFDHRSHDCYDIVRFASGEEAKEQERKDASERIAQAVEPFKPFDRVLVCNNKKERLIPRLFSQKIGELFYCQDGKSYKFCIPYDGNEGAQYIV